MKSNNNRTVLRFLLRFFLFLESSSSVVSGVIQTTCGMFLKLFFLYLLKFGVIAKIFFNQLENKLGCSFSFKHYTLTRHNNNEKSFLILYTKQQQIMSQNSSNDYLSVIYTGSIVLFTLALKGERILMMMMMMSHVSFPFKSPFFIGDIFFLLILLPPRHRARERQRETESGDLRESSVCLFLSRRVFLRARSCCVPSWMASCCLLGVFSCCWN